MKTSINKKLFYTFACLIIFIICFIWILNTLILDKYYISEKKVSLVSIYDSINAYYSNINNSEEALENELEKLDITQNVDIVIRNGSDITIYTTSKDFSRNKMYLFGNKNLIEFNDNRLLELAKKGKKYDVNIVSDSNVGTEFINLFGRLDNGFLIFIRTPVESITESVRISNKFLIFIGAISILISSIAVLLISKHFTKPLTELNAIAQNMANLDFSKKYKITTYDEIGNLGSSINCLSNNLEKTIKDLKAANMELEKDIEETSKISEMRSKFVSDVSHELKTPIALIQGYAEGLVDNVVSSDEDRKYYASVILDEANKMSELTKDLLDLSKLEYGQNQLQIEVFDIVEMIRTFLKKNEVLFSEKGIVPTFECDKKIMVKGDIFRIEQVLTNYTTNALKNVDEHKEIKFLISENEKTVRISVFNSGIQISDEDKLRIWNRFYKVDSSRNRANGGTGLGLSVVKAIIAQHHTICGVNNVDNGVEFYFELEKEC